MYTKELLKRFMHPKFMGEIKDADAVGEVGNYQCGDVMRIYVKIKDKKIKDIKFSTFGCPAALAASDALCELAKGKTIEEAEKITSKDIVNLIGEVPKIKWHCSVLGQQALKKTLENYKKR